MISHNISTRTIVKFFLIPLIGYVVWENRDVLFALLIGFILMSALRPAVNYLHHKKRIKRHISAAVVYVGFITFLSVVLGTIVPPIITETMIFIQKLPETLSSLPPNILKLIRLEEITQYIPNFTKDLVFIVGSIFSNTMLVITTLVFGFYLLAQDKISSPLIDGYVSAHTQNHFRRFMVRLEEGLSSWFWGELVLMLAVGSLSYIGFLVIGLRYALPLAVLAGLLEAIPTFGPTIAAIPAVLIGFSISPIVGFAALAWGFVVQQLENNLLVPYIMKRAVGISPIVTMLSIFIGLRLAGPLGVLLAVPTYVCIYALLAYRLEHKNSPTT
ncbi:MAG: AI-2E family transporter [bacterium]